MIKFHKLHGLGNDFIFFNCISQKLPVDKIIKQVSALSNRHFGIGSDGVILLLPSEKADIRMRIFDSFSGEEAEMCGNGARCVIYLAHKLKIIKKTKNILLETIPGIVEGEIIKDEVKIKLFYPPKVSEKSEKAEGFNFYRVDIGNPHAVISVPDLDKIDLHKIGLKIESNLKLFPNKTNVEFFQVISETKLRMKAWERGAGETLACGTGASAVAAVYRYLNSNKFDRIIVQMKGGDIELSWKNDDFYMKGGVEYVFEGDIGLETFDFS